MGANEIAQHNGTNNLIGNDNHEVAQENIVIISSGPDDHQVQEETPAEEEGPTELGRR